MNVMNISNVSDLSYTNSFQSNSAKISTQNTNKRSFESYILEAVDAVNEKQLDVSGVEQKLITDPDSVVTTAMAKAQMSLNLAQTVIDRLLTGWSELQTTR